MKKKYKYKIEGIVQGVGFRPFVYTLAKKYSIAGYVLNNSQGVEIVAAGDEDTLSAFEKELQKKLPPLARIDFITREFYTGNDEFKDFIIKESIKADSKYTLVSPDMSVCQDCLDELKDKKNHRYRYPFINCTNCGPRYSIIKTLPYDRVNTSMSVFEMCNVCKKEYTNPLDRRYHAQPVSCKNCGPVLSLKSIDGKTVKKGDEAISMLAEFINEGYIVALKGMGGFHLICDATNDDALTILRRRKKRPTKPFAVMFKDIIQLKKYAKIDLYEQQAIESIQRPIVIVHKGEKNLSNYIAPNIDRIGVFLPYTPLHVILFEYLQNPIVATSANRSGEPICSNEDDLKDALGDVIEYYLDYNRDIVNSSDDSVLQMIGDKSIFIRSSRGYMPASFRYKSRDDIKILAVGAHQKSSIALYMNNQVILSPYIGDLENLKSFDAFKKVVETFQRFYDFEPDLVVCDRHPEYFSTKFANSLNIEVVRIQHHYAHILATMFEHNLSENVLGVAWDGTGYGDDGTVWGGEFFVCNKKSYKRVALFEPFLLLGGDKSIKDIKRISLSMIFDIVADTVELKEFEAFLSSFGTSELKMLQAMHKKKLNSPLCSSVGRLFDAVAVFCGICPKASYDGESGLILEKFYNSSINEKYNIYIDNGIIRYKHIFREILKDKEPEIVASKFINGLAEVVIDVAKPYGLEIVLGGGVFQNRSLLQRIISLSEKNELKLYFPTKVPVNDSSISLGQIYSII